MSQDFFAGYLMGVIAAYFVFRARPIRAPKFEELEQSFDEHWSTVPVVSPAIYEALKSITKLAYLKGATYVARRIGDQIK